jgi:peptidoglycan hydrolase-like protein with peptidoglycan-binding domain
MESMQVKPRGRDVFQITTVGPYGGPVPRRPRRRWPWAVGLLVVAVVLAALAFGYFAWPRGSLVADPVALARISGPSLGGKLRVSARTDGGTAIPVSVRSDGTIWPEGRVAPGTGMVVEADFERPGWAGWLAGHVQRVELHVAAPVVALTDTWLRVKPGASLAVRFTGPVREVAVQGPKPRRLRLPRPARTVWLGHLGDAGSISLSAVARSWERPPPPENVTWFPSGGTPRILASPRPGLKIGIDTPIKLTVSEPVSALFHEHLPWLGPPSTGTWHAVDEHTLVYRPRGYGYGLDTQIKLRLPAAVTPVDGRQKPTRLLTWSTPTASELRLQQVLAQLGYLPLTWHPAGKDVAATQEGEVWAAAHPPAGTFTWRYGNVPSSLVKLWQPGKENVVTRGAVMAFQSSHDLRVDGYAGRDFWRVLIADAVAAKRASGSDYNYVIVHRDQSPQSLVLWHNGQTILTSPANTGIPKAPTALGTYPVYSHLTSTTMSGTNPDGTHYRDPGVPWVSYFNGGDAIHGFNRASYGSAQSLGCVELPPSEAAKVFPYTPVGTLVTVTS